MQIFIFTDLFLCCEFLHSLTLNQQLPFDDITLSPSDNNAKDITMKFAILDILAPSPDIFTCCAPRSPASTYENGQKTASIMDE